MKSEELKEVLRLHNLWLLNDKEGIRANLSYASLSDADLGSTDIKNAVFTETKLKTIPKVLEKCADK